MPPRDDPAAPVDAEPAVPAPQAGLAAELAAARAEAARLRERLDAAQEFGRLGTWEFDIASGHMAWDAATLRLAEGMESLAWGLVFALTPLSGVYYPIGVLPAWLQPVA